LTACQAARSGRSSHAVYRSCAAARRIAQRRPVTGYGEAGAETGEPLDARERERDRRHALAVGIQPADVTVVDEVAGEQDALLRLEQRNVPERVPGRMHDEELWPASVELVPVDERAVHLVRPHRLVEPARGARLRMPRVDERRVPRMRGYGDPVTGLEVVVSADVVGVIVRVHDERELARLDSERPQPGLRMRRVVAEAAVDEQRPDTPDEDHVRARRVAARDVQPGRGHSARAYPPLTG
jgi:hypothetical protein